MLKRAHLNTMLKGSLLICLFLLSGCELLGVKKQKCYKCETEIRSTTSSTTKVKEFCNEADKNAYFKDNNINVGGLSFITHCSEK